MYWLCLACSGHRGQELKKWLSHVFYRTALIAKLRLLNFKRSLRHADVPAAIDRVFRFFEMVFVAALIGLAYSVVDPLFGSIATAVLSLAAGAYLAHPFARWVNGPKVGTVWIAFCALAFGASAVSLVLPTQALVRATFQIDRDRAVEEYARAKRRIFESNCARRSSPRDFVECLENADEYQAEIMRKNGH